MLEPFPTISFDVLFHVGSFDPSHKQAGSYEGAGLSVSLHPEEWSFIAKLGGNPTWSLRRPGNRFLDAHAISLKNKHAIMAWAVQRGYAEPCDTWRWRYYDDEVELYLTCEFLTHEEAMREAYGLSESEKEMIGTVRKCSGHRSTPLLDKITQQKQPAIGNELTLDFLYPVYADEVLSLDGVWWADRLDPNSYSAPRGVISQRSLPTWQRYLTGSNPVHPESLSEAA